MRTQLRRPRTSFLDPRFLGVAGCVGTAWALDAWRRERKAGRLHRTLVELLLNALHAGDARTERHSRRVADLTDALAQTYGLDARERARLRLAALLHDLGKIDDELTGLVQSGKRLSGTDRRAMQKHPRGGAQILRPLENIHPGITAIVEAHHESWDGEGYPRGRRGWQIPLEARILGVADVFDALTQPRSYRAPLSVDQALARIREGAGEQFDPDVVGRIERPDVLGRWREIAGRGRRDEQAAAASAAREAAT